MYFSFVFNSVGLENNVLFLFSFKFRLVSMPQLKSHPFWCCGCYFCKSIRAASITIFSFFNASFTFYNLNTIHHPVKSFFFFIYISFNGRIKEKVTEYFSSVRFEHFLSLPSFCSLYVDQWTTFQFNFLNQLMIFFLKLIVQVSKVFCSKIFMQFKMHKKERTSCNPN